MDELDEKVWQWSIFNDKDWVKVCDEFEHDQEEKKKKLEKSN